MTEHDPSNVQKQVYCNSEDTDGICGIDEKPCSKPDCKKWLSILNQVQAGKI